jgi:hypothetical protein
MEMDEDDAPGLSAIEHQLTLLRGLEEAIRAQDRRQQDSLAETRQLRHIIEAAATRLDVMIAGQRASRTEIQAIIADLRAAIGPDATAL